MLLKRLWRWLRCYFGHFHVPVAVYTLTIYIQLYSPYQQHKKYKQKGDNKQSNIHTVDDHTMLTIWMTIVGSTNSAWSFLLVCCMVNIALKCTAVELRHETDWQSTDGQTDRQTDGRTDGWITALLIAPWGQNNQKRLSNYDVREREGTPRTVTSLVTFDTAVH